MIFDRKCSTLEKVCCHGVSQESEDKKEHSELLNSNDISLLDSQSRVNEPIETNLKPTDAELDIESDISLTSKDNKMGKIQFVILSDK